MADIIPILTAAIVLVLGVILAMFIFNRIKSGGSGGPSKRT
jgi:hypothetical protein